MQKQKVFDRDIEFPSNWKRFFLNGSTWTLWDYGTYANGVARKWTRNYKVRNWDVTPGWKNVRTSLGYLPTKDMEEFQYQWVQQNPTVVFVDDWATDFRTLKGCLNMMPSSFDSYTGRLSESEESALLLDAQYKCLSKARDMKANVTVFFGEGRQTVNMIADTARTLGRAYSAFRRGRFSKAAQILGINKPDKTLANHWLAYSLGWSPLVGELKGLAELAAQQVALGGRKPRLSVSATAKTLKKFSYTVNGQGPICLTGGASHHSGETQHVARAGLLLEVIHSEATLAAQLGVGLFDPILAAWEFTPFSFVFDYIIDIGSWLESLSSLQGMEVKAGFSSLSSACKGESSYSLPSGWSAMGPLPTTPFTLRYYRRKPWTGSITSVRTPLWDGLNARRLTTIASLWKQRTRGDRNGSYRP